MKSQSLNLYAVVPADEALKLDSAVGSKFGLVTWGPFTALVGASSRQCQTPAAAMRHDGVVWVALEKCFTVLPFRLGTCLGNATEVSSVLELNAQGLTEQLRRLHGRVEMGLKARMDPQPQEEDTPGIGLRFFEGLGGLRELAPLCADRHERFSRRADKNLFDGRYLVARSDVERFWSAVSVLRKSMPAVPMIASGPWAPYSFAEMVLAQGAERQGSQSMGVDHAAN